ncbi:hypothetical protein ACFRAO_20310 [Streptomyces sp. NPDC056656]|uniref:hypothetical protein n=1 Tax=Streptomyces sp. NPDC056656 TaxID=3345895 RepID=UPI0036CB5490
MRAKRLSMLLGPGLLASLALSLGLTGQAWAAPAQAAVADPSMHDYVSQPPGPSSGVDYTTGYEAGLTIGKQGAISDFAHGRKGERFIPPPSGAGNTQYHMGLYHGEINGYRNTMDWLVWHPGLHKTNPGVITEFKNPKCEVCTPHGEAANATKAAGAAAQGEEAANATEAASTAVTHVQQSAAQGEEAANATKAAGAAAQGEEAANATGAASTAVTPEQQGATESGITPETAAQGEEAANATEAASTAVTPEQEAGTTPTTSSDCGC